MAKDLKMEVFASKEKIKPIALFVYELHTQKIDNHFSVIRGATWKIRNHYKIGVFEDNQYIYTTEELDDSLNNVDFSLKCLGQKTLDVLKNKKVYSELIRYLITEKLRDISIKGKYRKYSCHDEITSKWILSGDEYKTFSSVNKEICLERSYGIWVDVLDDGKAYLQINTSSLFTSNLTIADYLQRGRDIIGLEVKNDWSREKQSGILTEVCEYTVTDKLDFADNLKAYYIGKNEEYRVRNIPDDTKVVIVEFPSGKAYPYYPQALKPILTRETVRAEDEKFSNQIDGIVKRDMAQRVKEDQLFIRDIGQLEEIGNLTFNVEPCDVETLGYQKGTVQIPELICGRDARIKCGNEYQVFNYGFYKKPSRAIKIGYIYPKKSYEYMKAVVNAIYSFAVKGNFHGADDKYILSGLIDIQLKPMHMEEYAIGDITDYKRAARALQRVEGIDIVIALVPDGKDEDGPYNPFKSIWAKANIPSQMISMSTAKLFATESENQNTTKYYLHNIVLGLLGKTGGIPWIVKDMPGNVDCFVGLDVATVARGIHYPACSVVFDKFGKLLGFYKPSTPQQGEKITTRILQDIFDQVLFTYEEQYGEYPKSIVIHRDGFSNEDDEWYEHYFKAKNIEYSLIEVRKNNHTKLIMYEDGKILNPTMGYCIFNDDKAYLVTTNMGNKKGSPNPLLIERKFGKLSMPQILNQILALSQLHVGSTHKMRLPITTGYADKICKNKDYVPEGKVDDRLFFL